MLVEITIHMKEDSKMERCLSGKQKKEAKDILRNYEKPPKKCMLTLTLDTTAK